MPRSESGICHIMLREINRQTLFEDEEDNRKFPEIQSDCKAVSGYKLFACCLAGSHRFCIEKDESGVIINENTADFCGIIRNDKNKPSALEDYE